MTPILFRIPVRTTNPLNAQAPNTKRASVIIKKKHAKQHSDAAWATKAAIANAGAHRADLIPCRVTMWRVSSRRPSKGRRGALDDDGNIAALKWVRDGIAEAIGIDDGSVAISWRYGQHTGRRGDFGVIVRLERKAT